MNRFLTGVMLTGAMLLGACGGVETSPGDDVQLDTVEQGIAPLDCGVEPNQYVTYYSNSTRTVEVGRRDCTCDGNAIYYGEVTPWYRAFSYNVCG